MKTRTFLFCLTCLVVAATAWAPSANAMTAAQPLDLLDVLTMRRFAWHAPIALSADGRLAAYVIRRPTSQVLSGGNAYTETGAPYMFTSTDVWLTDIASGETRNLTGEKGSSWAAAWSPDGRTLAFCSDRDGTAGLWLWDRETDVLLRAGQFITRASWVEWSPDGRRILLRVLPEGDSLPGRVSSSIDRPSEASGGHPDLLTVRVFRSEKSPGGGTSTQNTGRLLRDTDLALVEVPSGKLDRIVRGVSPFKAVFSPDGHYIAFSETTGDNVPGSHALFYTLKSYALGDRQVKMLVPPDEIGWWGTDFSWSPDSRAVAFRLGPFEGDVHLVSPDGDRRPATTMSHPTFKGVPAWDPASERLLLLSESAVWSVSTADGSAREITGPPGRKMQMFVPVTTAGDRVWLRDGGKSVVIIASDGIRKEFYAVPLESGRAQLLFGEQKEYQDLVPGLVRYNVLGSPATGRIAYVAEDAQHPEDLWVTDSGLTGSTQLTRLNPKINAVPMGALRLVEWTGNDGLPYTGALVLPSDYEPGKRYPLVIHVYPRDVLSEANRFGSNFGSNGHFNLQLYATRGYAALYVGGTWLPADREPMKAAADAVLPGIDQVIAMGVADPERIGVFGVSAGGYSTLALIVQSTRFKVAMAQAGAGNLLSLYGGLRDSGYSHGLAINENSLQMPDHPWKDRDRYIRNSPWFFLDKVETPLLLIHGTDDQASTVNQSNEVFVGLKRLGKTAQYARYVGEGHALSSLPNQLDAGGRLLDWFEKYLKQPPHSH